MARRHGRSRCRCTTPTTLERANSGTGLNQNVTVIEQLGDAADSFITLIRLLSGNELAFPNTYWMWWTRGYGGGCADIEA